MRLLFVPACLCLMTSLPGAAGTDAQLSLDQFTGVSSADKKVLARAMPAAAETTGSAPDEAVVIDIPADAPAPEIAADTPPPAAEIKAAELRRIPLPPEAKPVVQRTHREICETLTEAAQSNDLPIPFFIRLLFQESGFKPGVVSSAGAQGIAQFMPETAASVGLKNPFDPLQAIPASARLLRNLVQKFGNLGLAAAAYNAGPRRIQEWLGKKGKLPQETQGYVKTITGRPVENWAAASAVHPGQKLPRRAPCQEAAGAYAWNGSAAAPLPPAAPQPHRSPASASRRTAVASAAHRAPKRHVASHQLAARRHAIKKRKVQKLAQR